MDLEGFCITMATVVNFPKKWLCHDALMPTLGLCVQFRQDPLRIDWVVNRQRYPGLAYYDMMRTCWFYNLCGSICISKNQICNIDP